MATLRDIKNRIVGVKNTQQITKAMKMVAAARLRRAQENIINARPYSKNIKEVLTNLLSIEKNIDNDLVKQREIKSAAIVVITSDRGLCGGFNMNAIRFAEERIKQKYSYLVESSSIKLYCVGKKGIDYFKNRPTEIVGKYPGIFSDLKFEFAASLTSELKNKFINNEFDLVEVIYNEFKSVAQQRVTVEQLLPISVEESQDEKSGASEFIFEPDKISIINSLLPRYLNSRMWNFLLESYAAELGARMTAMDMATENAKELIRSLQITYNKERQASITSEILEIVSGANALKKS